MQEFNIFEEKERGSYTPGFFLMKVSFPFDTNNLSELSEEELGTFAHEYIHFLQNTSTPFGLWQAMVYYQVLGEFFAFVQKNKPTNIPITEYQMSEVMQQRYDLEVEASGHKKFIKVGEDEKFHFRCSSPSIHGKHVNRITLSFNDIYGNQQEIILGGHIIKESMAAMLQEVINPGSQTTHDVVPYHVVQRIANQIAPNIKDDVRKLLGLCFISLHTLCPGYTLCDYLRYANANPEMSLLEIFDYFLENSPVKTSTGKQLTIEQLGDDIVEAFKSTLQNFLFGKDSDLKIEYLSEILDRVKLSNGLIPLLRLIAEYDINSELIQAAINACGTPVIWNDFGDLSIPNTVDNSSPDKEIWILIVYQALYKKMINKNQIVCPMFQICPNCRLEPFRLEQFKDECYEFPWEGQECMMTIIGHYFGLN